MQTKPKWTKEKRERYMREGRGRGIGADYKGWIKTHEFSSIGRATRIQGVKINRVFYLNSDLQYRAFLYFEWCSKVHDIRECYPLLDIDRVIDKKDDLRFDKFCDKASEEPYVLTTNFLLTIVNEDGEISYKARTIKHTSELKKRNTWEKLEIEKRYWASKKVEWKVITEKQLSRQIAQNIEWVRETLLTSDLEDQKPLSNDLFNYLEKESEQNLNNALHQFDHNNGLEKGTALYLFRYLIATKQVKVDMDVSIDLSRQIQDLFV